MGLNKGGFFFYFWYCNVSVSKQDAINCNIACFCYLYMGSLFFIEFWRFFLIKCLSLLWNIKFFLLLMLLNLLSWELPVSVEWWRITLSLMVSESTEKGQKGSNFKMFQWVKQNTVSTLDLICMCSTSTCQHAVIVSSAALSFAFYYDFEFLWGFFSISFDLHYRVIYF